MRKLVIGGSGYIGKNLVKNIPKGQLAGWTYFRRSLEIDEHAYRLNVNDKTTIKKLLTTVNPDVIYYLAYDNEDYQRSIIDGTDKFLRSVKKLNKNILFVFLSTDVVFDGRLSNYEEASVPKPICDYGEAKRAAELLVLSQNGIVVRTSIVYGFDPLDQRTKDLFIGLSSGNFLYNYFINEFRSPIFVEDLCKGLLEVGSGVTGEHRIIHIAGPESLSRYNFAKKIANCFGFSQTRIPQVTNSCKSRPLNTTLDISLAQSKLKTRLRSVEEVAKDIINCIDDNPQNP